MTKILRKAIMHRSAFKNSFNKYCTYENWCDYKIHRNYCISLLRKTKQQHFKNLNFWRTIKPYFNEKRSNLGKKALSGNESALTNEKEIANTVDVRYFECCLFRTFAIPNKVLSP